MKNKEKYAKEIVELACDGNRIAVVRQTGEFRSCYKTACIECLFHSSDREQCRERTREWAESEYIEKPVISKRDRAFLDCIMGKYKYIARDKTGYLYAYREKPDKHDVFWSRSICEYFGFNNRIDVCFPLVKWEDDEPWLIEDLKKLEVVDSYE